LSITPTAVKVAEIAPWIHHSWLKPASLQEKCIPNPASQCKITPQPERLPSAGLHFPRNYRGPRTTGQQPCSSHPKSWLVYIGQKLRSQLSNRQTGCFSHQLSHCNALSFLICVCCCCSHPSLSHKLGRNLPHWLISQWKVCICSLLSLLSRMHNYYLLLLIWFNKGQNMQPSFTRRKLPLTAPMAPVTL
jgi:hypothetical protein